MTFIPLLSQMPRRIIRPFAAGNSIHFDGVDDKITATKTGLGAAGSSYAVCAWVKADALDGTANAILSEKKTDNTGSFPFYLGVDSDNKFFFRMFTGSTYTTKDPDIPLVSTWYHIMGIRNDADDNLRIYRNGTEKHNIIYTDASSVAATPANLFLGLLATINFFPGLIKDVRIFNVALGAGDRAALALVANLGKLPSEIRGFVATNTQQIRFYPFKSVFNSTINKAGAINDHGANGVNGTGANFAGTTASGVSTDVPA